MKLLLIAALIITSACSSEKKGVKAKKVSSKNFKLEKIYEGDGILWSFSFISPSEVLIAHKDGKLYHYNLKNKKKTQLEAPEVWASGQGGLLDVLYHKGDVFITYSKPNPKGKAVTALAKGALKEGKLQGLKDIFVSNADGDGGIHFGSRLVIRGDELFMSIGERGERDKAQSLDFHNGKVLRLKFDGSPYPGNPFMGKKGLDEIFTYGHRNPQGITLFEGKVYEAEMGPRGGDEINLLKAGANYGWPVITYGNEYYGPKIGEEKKEGMEQPLTYWVPSISPSGIAFYNGDMLLGCLSGTQIRLVKFKDGAPSEQQELFFDLEERFRSVESPGDGHWYFSTDSGKIYRVSKQ